jgi:glycosyltransferase involved in cell wall biosynthesis
MGGQSRRRAGSGRILLHDTVPARKTIGGVARVFQQIAAGIIEHFGDRAVVYSPMAEGWGDATVIKSMPRFFPTRSAKWLGFNAVMSRLGGHLAAAAARRAEVDVIYSPFYGWLPTGIPQIFMVHDFIYERLPKYFEERRVYRTDAVLEDKRRCLLGGCALVAVSHNTKRDILELYPNVSPQKIHVIHHGVDEVFFQKPGALPAPTPYFLFVGNRGLYKNFGRLLEAYAQSGLADEFDLLCVSPSGHGFSPEEHGRIRRHGIDGRVKLIVGADEQQLCSAYAHSVALIYPSEYEGFGLPVLEALASGTLVLASNSSSLPEVGGAAPRYFDCQDVNSIASSLRWAASLTEGQRAARILQGVNHAKTFTWRRAREHTLELIDRILREQCRVGIRR